MLYVIDTHGSPNVVVLETEDAIEAERVAKAYASQTQRAVVIAERIHVEEPVVPVVVETIHPH